MNTFPLAILEKAFETAAYRAYSDSISMYEAALIETPEIMLHISDEYTSSLLNHYSSKFKNIVVVCGYG
jgi:hypothetical protein